MALKHSYTVLAPLYDFLVSKPMQNYRIQSLARLEDVAGQSILLNGIGTGLDIPFLPEGAHYTGTDITPAMLKFAEQRAEDSACMIELLQADSMRLPFDDNSFDHIIMHLILAVVPEPERALSEACRVLKPGGNIYLYDKFLRPGQRAPVKRLLNILTRHVATRTDVVFEDVLSTCSQLSLTHDEPSLAGGWFRLIELHKSTAE